MRGYDGMDGQGGLPTESWAEKVLEDRKARGLQCSGSGYPSESLRKSPWQGWTRSVAHGRQRMRWEGPGGGRSGRRGGDAEPLGPSNGRRFVHGPCFSVHRQAGSSRGEPAGRLTPGPQSGQRAGGRGDPAAPTPSAATEADPTPPTGPAPARCPAHLLHTRRLHAGPEVT